MNKTKRVLQVLASLDKGGAESMILTLYRNIDRDKVQFDFVVNDNDKIYDFEEEIISLGGRIYRVPRFNLLNSMQYVKAWNKLFDTYKEWKIIHAHHTSPASIFLTIAKNRGLITIAHSHTAGGKSYKSKVKVISRFPLRYMADHLLSCSVDAAKWMFGNKWGNAVVLNNAIDSSRFKYNLIKRERIRAELRISNKLVVGHIGNFTKPKNYPFILKVFQSVYEKNKHACLLLVGNKQNNPEVEKNVTEMGLKDSVVFTGVRSDIPELLMAMDIFLFPSLHEGLPVTVIEAQASGLKCFLSDSITTEVGITKLVEFISLHKSPEYWAEKLLSVSDGYKRKDMHNDIVEASYDIEENAKWLQEFYLSHYQ